MKVALVEDTDMVRAALHRALTKVFGYEVMSFPTADEALEPILEQKPTLVLTDTDMPGQLDGVALLKEVKAKAPDIIVINMSGRADERLIAEAKANGSSGFLVKPFNLKDLEAMLKELGLLS